MSGATDAPPGDGRPAGPVSIADLTDRVRAADPRLGRTRVVVVDGPAGSGKTTLAGRLGTRLAAPVLHADDFLAGWADLEGWWSRLEEWVLTPFAAGRPARLRRYDWLVGDFGGWQDLPVPEVLVVEGCGSARRAADRIAVLRVWVEAPDDVRLRRGLDRDGEELRGEWVAWMAAEREHFAAEGTRARADVLVDGCASMER